MRIMRRGKKFVLDVGQKNDAAVCFKIHRIQKKFDDPQLIFWPSLLTDRVIKIFRDGFAIEVACVLTSPLFAPAALV